MTYLLQGVVERGTAASASDLLDDKPLAGKTGTTDKYTDAWFIGFSPSLCAGVWVGNDDNKPLGGNESGAVAALPIWIGFLPRRHRRPRRRRAEAAGAELKPEEFDVPTDIVFEAIDRKTGLLRRALLQVAVHGGLPRRHRADAVLLLRGPPAGPRL